MNTTYAIIVDNSKDLAPDVIPPTLSSGEPREKYYISQSTLPTGNEQKVEVGGHTYIDLDGDGRL
jgi:hypothetical protein